MLQKLRILASCCATLTLLGCAASQAKLTAEPAIFDNIQPTPAKKIIFDFDVSLENNSSFFGTKRSVEQWTQYAENLVEKIEALGLKADFTIKFEKFASPDPSGREQQMQDATHLVWLTEERGTLYGSSLIDVFWNASVLQLIPNAEYGRTTYKKSSSYKYKFVGWDCFINQKLHSDDYTKNCLDAHANFQIAQLKKAGIIK